MATQEPAMRRQPATSSKGIWCVLGAVVVAFSAHAACLGLLLPLGTRYHLNWHPHAPFLLIWLTLWIFGAPLLAVATIVWVMKKRNEYGVLAAIGLLGIALALGLPTYFAGWLVAAVGSRQVVAEIRLEGEAILLEHGTAGNPEIVSEYYLRQCTMTGTWCAELGKVYEHAGNAAAEPCELRLEPDGAIAVSVGDIRVAELADVR